MFCPACGKGLPDDAVVCVGCGRAVAPLYLPAYAPGSAKSPELAEFARAVSGLV